MVNLIVSGDFSPNLMTGYDDEICHCSEIQEIISKAHLSFVNLECPLSGQIANPTPKQGPSLIGKVSALNIIKGIGFTDVTMANNHILDYGEETMANTIKAVKDQGLDYVGVGKNIEDAYRIMYKTIDGVTIAIINCCEHEFSVATENRGGASPLDPVIQYSQIIEAKHKSDYVIMIIHGGVEHYQYPTPRMVKTYRFFVDAGADAVINHHQHCPCGYEEYKGKPIFYGLGNFFFPWEGKRNSIWNLGYMVSLSLEIKRRVEYKIIPYRQCDGDYDIKLLEGDELQEFYQMMNRLNVAIQDENVLKDKLNEFNSENNFLYKKMFEPYSGRLMNGLYRRGFAPSFMSKERVLALIDFLGCESHYERVLDYLNETYNNYFNEYVGNSSKEAVK